MIQIRLSKIEDMKLNGVFTFPIILFHKLLRQFLFFFGMAENAYLPNKLEAVVKTPFGPMSSILHKSNRIKWIF